MSISANFPNLKPSFLADFANSQVLDSRITFSRSTTAPYYDGKTSVLAEQNLVRYSQGTGMAANWGVDSGGASTRTDNYAVAPDGTTTAMRFVTTSSPYPNMSQSVSVPTAGTYTLSFYASVPTGTQAFSGGTLSIAGTATTTWQRFTATGTLSAGTQNIYLFNFGPTPTAGQELWIWGVQLEQRSSVTAYNATTTTAITNYIPQLLTAPINAPRFDFNPTTGESLGLLIEQSSTNLLTYSQDFSNAVWTKSNATIIATADIAPDGTQTAQLLVENTSTSSHGFYLSASYSQTNGQNYTQSVYLKAKERTWIVLQPSNGNPSALAYFNLGTGAIGTLTNCTATITLVGNGWYRCTATYTATVTTTTTIGGVFLATGDGGASYTGNGYNGAYVWGNQFEALAFPTSYIPTTSAQVTRASDNASMTGTNFSSWYNISQSTLYVEANITTPSNYLAIATLVLNNGTNTGIGLNWNSNGRPNYFMRLNGAFNPNLTIIGSTGQPTGSYKMGIVVTTTPTIFGAESGTLGSTVSSYYATQVNPNALFIGLGENSSSPMTGYIKKLAYYPQAVTSTQLQALTGT